MTSTQASAPVDTERLADALSSYHAQHPSQRSSFRSAASTVAALEHGRRPSARCATASSPGSEGITPATLSRIVAALEEEGHLRRTPDPEDGRASWLETTASGRRLVTTARRARAQVLDTRLGRLTPAQARALGSALEALDARSPRTGRRLHRAHELPSGGVPRDRAPVSATAGRG